jgi:hypothetical protein
MVGSWAAGRSVGVVAGERVRVVAVGAEVIEREDRDGLSSCRLFFLDLEPVEDGFAMDDRRVGRIGDESRDANGEWLTELLAEDCFEGCWLSVTPKEALEVSNMPGRWLCIVPTDWLASGMPFVVLADLSMVEDMGV